MKTTDSNHVCPKCGNPVPADAPRGLCPVCVLGGAATVKDSQLAGRAPTATGEIPSISRVAAAFPQLEILELIGRGGMGFVFKARQPRLDRFVALKLLPDKLAHDPQFAERFNREGRVLARLNHPNIVSVFDFGRTEHFYYLTMEYVDGVNLRQGMQAGRFSPAEALAIVPKVCEALQYAHEQGVLHRDIKPENILLDARGRVKIADFGIAKLVDDDPASVTLTGTGAALGTPHYMAPEQLERPSEVDHRADIYSLGVVFYEMLTGELPLGRFAPPSAKTPVNSGVDDVVFRTLERDREKRFQSAGEVKTRVEHLTDLGLAAAPANPAAPDAARLEGSRPGDTGKEYSYSFRAFAGTAMVGLSLVKWRKWVFAGLLACAYGVVLYSRTTEAKPDQGRPAPTIHSTPAIAAGSDAIRVRLRIAKGQAASVQVFRYDTDPPTAVPAFAGYFFAPDDERGRAELLLEPVLKAGPGTRPQSWRMKMVSEDGASVIGGAVELGPLSSSTSASPNNVLEISPGAETELLLTAPSAPGETNVLAPRAVLSLRVQARARRPVSTRPVESTTVSVGTTNWVASLLVPQPAPTPGPAPEILAYQWWRGPAGTNTTNWVRYTMTAVELRRLADGRWLAMDFVTDTQGGCERAFSVHGNGFKAVTRTSEFLLEPKGSPLVRHQRVEWLLPEAVKETEALAFRDALAKEVVRQSVTVYEGEQRPLFRFPIGTVGDLSVGLGAKKTDRSGGATDPDQRPVAPTAKRGALIP